MTRVETPSATKSKLKKILRVSKSDGAILQQSTAEGAWHNAVDRVMESKGLGKGKRPKRLGVKRGSQTAGPTVEQHDGCWERDSAEMASPVPGSLDWFEQGLQLERLADKRKAMMGSLEQQSLARVQSAAAGVTVERGESGEVEEVVEEIGPT